MKLCRLSKGLSGEVWTCPLSGRWTGGKTAVGRGRGPARAPLSPPGRLQSLRNLPPHLSCLLLSTGLGCGLALGQERLGRARVFLRSLSVLWLPGTAGPER